jgi:hypothetical protein
MIQINCDCIEWRCGRIAKVVFRASESWHAEPRIDRSASGCAHCHCSDYPNGAIVPFAMHGMTSPSGQE